MTRDHFSKVMQSPYFRSRHYQEDSHAGKLEAKIENFLKKFLFKRKKK
jgi:hypothetical protein